MNKLSASNNERLIQLDVREQILDEEIELLVKQNEKVLTKRRPPKKTKSNRKQSAVRSTSSSDAGGSRVVATTAASPGTPEKEVVRGGPPTAEAQKEDESNKAPNNAAQEGSATVNVNCVWSESDDRIFLGELYSILNRRMNNSSSNGNIACHTVRSREGSSKAGGDLSSKRDGNQTAAVQQNRPTRGNLEDNNNNINGEHHDKISMTNYQE